MALISTIINNTNTTILTSSGSNAITSMVICNLNGSTANLTLFAVPSGSLAGPSTTMIYQLPIVSGETLSLDQEKLVLGNGDSIIAVSSLSSALTIIVSTLAV